MQRSKLSATLMWELKNLSRFPLPEALLALFVYVFFMRRGGVFCFSAHLEGLDWLGFNRTIAFHTILGAAHLSSQAYIPMGIFASILATLSFAYEIENGLLKVYLSHPISRAGVFLSKFLSCFFLIYTAFSTSLLTYALLRIPENTPYFVFSGDLVLRMLFLAAVECFFVVSLAISFSIFSERASVSLIGSFVVIYILQLVSGSVGLPYLPPTSFREQAFLLFSSIPPQFSDILNFAVAPMISTVLVVFSYLNFSRRLEIP